MYNTYSRTTREYDLWHTGTQNLYNTHTHPFNGPLSRTTWVSRYQKGKTNLDFTEARDSEWQWHQLGHMQVCTSLHTDNHANTPLLSFLQAGCPSCRPTNSVKALWKIPGLPGSFWDGLAICLSEPATPTGLILSCRSPVFLATQDSVPW